MQSTRSSTQDADDRRRHPRISLKAYGFHHYCAVLFSGSKRSALLIDITPAGARLRFEEASMPLHSGQEVELLLQLQPLAGITPPDQPVESQVRWTEGREWGVQFQRELDCTVSDLQRLLDRAQPDS
jgi:hypothetical protein